MVRRAPDKDPSNCQTRFLLACKRSKNRLIEKPKGRQCKKIEREILHGSGRRRVQRNYQIRKKNLTLIWKRLFPERWRQESVFRSHAKLWRVETLTHTRKPSMLVLWKLTNLQGSVWSLVFREIMTTTSQRNDSIF